ncbi:hypothetical protein [Deinococcus sp. QL22]|uniref:hypothetical protein n=1 Tax=Deinococcus sp. QL22 TaxID=2939437 RepID=UPI002017A4B1|nr:hypothetical protein [Deinococcus sp. QL22]UQN05894.1 hypothetical protein M1R55_13625 [Deinococcus sp. QL22]
MPARLNLAALTAEELQVLYGVNAAQSVLPDVSRARLEGRTLPGPDIQMTLTFAPLPERGWGASPEQTRALAAEDAALRGLGAQELGVHYAPLISGARHQRAYLLEPDTALALRWSETPDTTHSPHGQTPPPFVQAVTWLKDRASGVACVLTTAAAEPPTPTLSEQIDLHRHPDLTAAALLDIHRAHVLRHGRGQKLTPTEHAAEGWVRAWQAVYALNVAAWTRRGLLLDIASDERERI